MARILGVATLGYGAAIAWRPRLLTRPCGLAEDAPTVLLTRALGVRDAVIGAAMVVVPAPALPTVVLARTAVDLGDALVFGLALPGAAARSKAAGVALTWAGLCAWTLTTAPAPAAPVVEAAGDVALRGAQSLSRSSL
ncbi:hypothetical protein [Streptomyces sp. NPDC048606]|uniref:hypothetical protein n=1 Tax=Streptomyces sp. NPDC048606 TaxID=3154726 RepID=UPI00341949E1